MKPGYTESVRVLHIINGEHYSGAERVQDLLGEGLARFGFEVGYACVKPDLFPKVYKAKACPVYSLSKECGGNISTIKKLVQIVRAEKYKLIHTHMPRTAATGRIVSAITRVPMVYHIHGAVLFYSHRRLKGLFAAGLERISSIGAKRVIACSEEMRRYARAIGISGNMVTVIANGIPGYTTVSKGRSLDEEFVIGMVALSRPRKGLEDLLHAMKLLQSGEGSHVRLRGVGDFISPEYKAQIEHLVLRLGIERAVEWTGFTNNIYEELEKMDCFVLPSMSEGLSIALLEAMSAGVPVIATRIRANEEIIRQGHDGFLCEPGEARSLAACIEQMITLSKEELQSMRNNVRRRQQENFSRETMCERMADVYADILGVACTPSRLSHPSRVARDPPQHEGG